MNQIIRRNNLYPQWELEGYNYVTLTDSQVRVTVGNYREGGDLKPKSYTEFRAEGFNIFLDDFSCHLDKTHYQDNIKIIYTEVCEEIQRRVNSKK